MIALIIIIILILSIMNDSDKIDEWEASERNADRRHQELLSQQRKELNRYRRANNKRRTRTIARDEHGRFIAQEIIENGGDEDFDDE